MNESITTCIICKGRYKSELFYIHEISCNMESKYRLRNKCKKGSLCSASGKKYELKIHKIISKSLFNGVPFNTQSIDEIGGSTANIDLLCVSNIGIECKKASTPDWMQYCIKWNSDLAKFAPSSSSKNPSSCTEIFTQILNEINLYNGAIPPFMERKLKYEEWCDIKKEDDRWNDLYIDIPNNTIKELYWRKGCQYIQVSDGYGLYHLGNDPCDFNVPEFIVDQQLRIRIKVHTKCDKMGFTKLSIMAACQPKPNALKSMVKSVYSLDSIEKLPPGLTYDDNLGGLL